METGRRERSRLFAAALALFGFLSPFVSFAQGFSGADSLESKPAKAMVAFLFPEQISIPARKPTTVDLHFRVADGLHINSHTPREKSLIPTNLAVAEMKGLTVTGVDFPPGIDYSFAFDPKEELSVYTGDFVLRAHLTAPAGQYLLQGLLRYQACNSNSCYPPKTIPVAVDVIAK
ncbi:MAG TPA: protein-disulfide reductase DsbD domain-containing protein [Silvibacterium sp.]|nr:protein-disulfide reductase DsbD domain-containing protein [Silvibacterium sp.]